MSLDLDRVLAIACPYCHAQPGVRCVTKNGGRYTGDFHVHRKGVVYPRFMTGASGGPKRGVRKLREEQSA